MAGSFSWLAVRGGDADAIRRELSLRKTGEVAASPNSPLTTTELAGGWRLVLAERMDFADSAPHAQLSNNGELITCTVDEGRMHSSASGWANGVRQWYIVHDGEIGIQHIHIEGQPPPEFHPIYNRLVVDQIEAGGLNITVDHVFEVPIELARALTGFRRDDAEANAGLKFQRLEDERS